jgi:predicted MFS family arabinose efflux permease
MFLIGTAHNLTAYTTAAVLFGVATGITSPTLFAWTADLSHKDRRGVGSGTMFIALELGIMLGSISTIFTYNNHFETIYIGFSFGILMAVLAAAYLIWHLSKRKSLT